VLRGVVGLCYRVTPTGAKVRGLVSEPLKGLSVMVGQVPPRLRYGVVLSEPCRQSWQVVLRSCVHARGPTLEGGQGVGTCHETRYGVTGHRVDDM